MKFVQDHFYNHFISGYFNKLALILVLNLSRPLISLFTIKEQS